MGIPLHVVGAADGTDRLVPTPWGDLVRCLVQGACTSGAYSVAEITTSPGWRRPTYVHHLADETFYVAAGAVTVAVDGTRPLLLTAGGSVHVPRGTARALSADLPGRLLLVQTPGGLLEQPSGPLTAASVGLELVDPPA